MDAQQFLAEFGHIANAPGGVAKLRELVIQLAISGRLVERIETEAPVSRAMKEAAEQRNIYETEMGLRASRMHPPLRLEPFPVPGHWQWTRLEQICLYIQRGKSPKYVDRSSTHVISQKCVQWAGFDLSSARFVADDSLASYGEERFLRTGDLLWNSTGTGTVGRVAVYKPSEIIRSVADSHVTVIRLANCSSQYLWCVIASPWVQSRINPAHQDSLVSGTTQQVELNTSTARALPIPLPPVAEQSRIVAKVDELMALCDTLEGQQQTRRTLQNNLRKSTLQALADAQNPHAMQIAWRRLEENFELLFSAPEDINDLKKLIAELAIHGALDADGDPTGTAAVDIYLAELSRKKTGKRFAKAIHVEEEFSLPNGWQWVFLEDLLAYSESGWSPKCDPEPRRNGEWGVLKVSAVTWGAFNPEENKRLPGSLEARHEHEVKPGDFMLSRANTAELVARSVIAPTDCPKMLLMSDKIVRLTFLDDKIKPWVNLVNNSELARAYYKDRATGTSDSMRNVSRQVIHELPVPLPPLQTQKKVLNRLSCLMRVIEKFERQIKSCVKLNSQLAGAILTDITGISSKYGESSMKLPQTELIATIRLGITPDIKTQAPLATLLARNNSEMLAKDLWQRFGGEIDAFYAQLKTEVSHGWIQEPTVAEMREKFSAPSVA